MTVKLPRVGLDGPPLVLTHEPSSSWTYGKTTYSPGAATFAPVQVIDRMPSVAAPDVRVA